MSKTKNKPIEENFKPTRRSVSSFSTPLSEGNSPDREMIELDWSKEISEILTENPCSFEEAVRLLSTRVVSKLYPDLEDRERLETITFVSDMISANEDFGKEIRRILLAKG